MAVFGLVARPRLTLIVPLACILILTWIYISSAQIDNAGDRLRDAVEELEASSSSFFAASSGPSVELVVSATKATNTSWLSENFPNYPAHIYIADDASAPLTVERNVGHESNIYLTYIIDNYDKLPDVAIFLHGRRYQWHNEDPEYDGVPPLKKLQIPYVLEQGFSTLRCSWLLGCPIELHPSSSPKPLWTFPDSDQRGKTEAIYATSFRELFPGEPLPTAVGSHCGAQFATTRERIRARPKERYIAYREWLWSTELTDEYSGRVMEYSWHQILGQPAVDCPDAGQCFCRKFGMCDLKCKDYGCAGTYFFNFGELPTEWPDKGWGTAGWPQRDWAADDPLLVEGVSNAKWALDPEMNPTMEDKSTIDKVSTGDKPSMDRKPTVGEKLSMDKKPSMEEKLAMDKTPAIS